MNKEANIYIIYMYSDGRISKDPNRGFRILNSYTLIEHFRERLEAWAVLTDAPPRARTFRCVSEILRALNEYERIMGNDGRYIRVRENEYKALLEHLPARWYVTREWKENEAVSQVLTNEIKARNPQLAIAMTSKLDKAHRRKCHNYRVELIDDGETLEEVHSGGALLGNGKHGRPRKHYIGSIHPNGKWILKEYKPGKIDWRKIKE